MVCVMWRSTISPVIANRTVIATEVESRIFASRDSLEKRASLFGRSRIGAVVDDRRVVLAVLVQVRRRDVAGLGDRDQRQRQPLSGTVIRRSRNLRFSGSARSWNMRS